MNKYGLQGSLKAKPGKGNELASILLKASELVSNAKGCHIYLVSQDVENRDIVWVNEVWDSQEDHDNSLKTDEVRALISQAMPILDGPPQKGIETIILGGKGL